MMSIIILRIVLCENERIFSLAPASESIVLFLDNPSVFLYLIQPDLFDWICFPRYISCWKY